MNVYLRYIYVMFQNITIQDILSQYTFKTCKRKKNARIVKAIICQYNFHFLREFQRISLVIIELMFMKCTDLVNNC